MQRVKTSNDKPQKQVNAEKTTKDDRSSRSLLFFKIGVLKNFENWSWSCLNTGVFRGNLKFF